MELHQEFERAASYLEAVRSEILASLNEPEINRLTLRECIEMDLINIDRRIAEMRAALAASPAAAEPSAEEVEAAISEFGDAEHDLGTRCEDKPDDAIRRRRQERDAARTKLRDMIRAQQPASGALVAAVEAYLAQRDRWKNRVDDGGALHISTVEKAAAAEDELEQNLRAALAAAKEKQP